MQPDALYWHRARSIPPPGCLWRLWRSASTLTQPFRPDGNVFCWWEFYIIHSSGHLPQNLYTEIPEPTISWCSISRTVRANSFVYHGVFPLRETINWSCSSLCTLALHYSGSWWPSTSVWIYLHPTTWSFIFLLRPVLVTIGTCTSRVILQVAAFAASRWTNWYLHRSSSPASYPLEEVPVN